MTTSADKPNIYQLSGLDDRERGFTRQVESRLLDGTYHVVLRYERMRFDEESLTDENSALQRLIKTLQKLGYTQLRSQLIFQGEAYLGTQELWIEYPDDQPEAEDKLSVFERINRWLNKEKSQKPRNRFLGQC
ncbi:MAG: hypothetical protein MRJ96_03575 [Nitrospirales bacterium]|nr:hypothetical protein [Nitrospira sp.]MDR4500518.1 hypothetical protein [Nitrospirales bacterium]